MQGLLGKKAGPMAGFLSAVLFFSLLHYITRPYDLNTMMIVVISGIFFGLVFYATGSVWIASVVHILNNLWGDFPTYLYLKGETRHAHVFAGVLLAVTVLICLIGRKSVSHFVKKTIELFASSTAWVILVGFLVGALALAYGWIQHRIQSHFGMWLSVSIVIAISAFLIGVSFFGKTKR